MSAIPTQENALTRDIVDRLTVLRFRWLTVNLLIALLRVVCITGAIWLCVALVDYVLELPWNVRKILVTVFGSVAVLGLLWMVGTVARSSSLKGMIKRLESRFSDFGQRLRTVVEIHEGRFEVPAPMQRVLGNQTLARWETSSPNQMIAYRHLTRWLVMSALLFGLLCTSLAMATQWSVALRRSLGANVPYTSLNVQPGNIVVIEGSEVTLQLELTGRQGRKVMSKWRKLAASSGNSEKSNATDIDQGWIENELDPSPSSKNSQKAAYSVELGKVKESLEYQFVTNVGVSERYRITVRPLVQVKHVQTTVTPPAYTKGSVRLFNELEVTVLSGSEIKYQWTMTQPLSELKIVVDPRSKPTEVVDAVATDDPRIWELSMPSESSLQWKTQGIGVDGTPLEVAKGRLRVREDLAPRISWKRGDESIEVHTLAEVPLEIAASDDFGIASAQIILQFADGDERVLADLNPEQINESATIDLATILPLETLKLTQKDYLGFYAVASDNCEPNPRSVATDVRFIDILPLRQRYKEIDLMPGEPGGREIKTLNDLMKTQRLLINQTRRLIKLPPEALVDQIRQIDRMVQTQSELAANVVFLAEFFVQQGNDDVESLRQAEASMLQAADSLAAGTFETALLQEQDALRWLVETRDLLQLLLTKNPEMSKQVKAALNALKMKIRRKRPTTALEIANQLEQVASDQNRIAEMSGMKVSKVNDTTEGEKGEPQGDLMKNEPMALATGLDSATVSPMAPEAVAYGSGDKTLSSTPIEDQQELVLTVNDISTQVTKQTWPSKLIPERMDELVKSISETEKSLVAANSTEFIENARRVGDQALELATHIRALNPEEPLESLNSLVTMTKEAAAMSNQASQSMRKGANGSLSKNGTSGQNGTNDKSTSQKLASRAETIEDVLASILQPGDNEASEAIPRIEAWMKQSGFSKTLAESKTGGADFDSQTEAADVGGGSETKPESNQNSKPGSESKEDSENKGDGSRVEGNDSKELESDESSGDQSEEREASKEAAASYAAASEFMQELYRELASPKLEQLRKLEAKARKLQSATSQPNGTAEGGIAGVTSDQTAEEEAKNERRELQDSLRKAGMEELADILMEATGGEGNLQSSSMILYRGYGQVPAGLRGVIQGLRYEIQAIITEQIGVDRDTPIPQNYIEAVDRYFEAIANPLNDAQAEVLRVQ